MPPRPNTIAWTPASTWAVKNTAPMWVRRAQCGENCSVFVPPVNHCPVSVREVLAQGCPLDLHPKVFGPDSAAGSVFFKASVWLWQTEAAPVYEVPVRNSFQRYIWLMLERCTPGCGLIVRRFS